MTAKNRKREFSIVTWGGAEYIYPYSKSDNPPSAIDPIEQLFVDKELGNEAFTYVLASGQEGSIHIEQVLEYNEDPEYLADDAIPPNRRKIVNRTAIGYNAKVESDNSMVLGRLETNVGIGTTKPRAALHVEGGQVVKCVTKCDTYCIRKDDYVILGNPDSRKNRPKITIYTPHPDECVCQRYIVRNISTDPTAVVELFIVGDNTDNEAQADPCLMKDRSIILLKNRAAVNVGPVLSGVTIISDGLCWRVISNVSYPKDIGEPFPIAAAPP